MIEKIKQILYSIGFYAESLFWFILLIVGITFLWRN
jgi:hypothetical protein